MNILKTGDKFSVQTIDGPVEFTVGEVAVSRKESSLSVFGDRRTYVTYELCVRLSEGILTKADDPAAIVGDM